MKSFKENRISILLGIGSVVFIIYGIIVKDYHYPIEEKILLSEYYIDFFGLEFSYKSFILFFTLMLLFSVYLFFFKSDKILTEVFIHELKKVRDKKK